MRSPWAVSRPVHNEYLVRQRDRRLLRELLAVLGAVVVVGAGLLAYTWIHIEILRSGYRVDALEKSLHRLEQEERRWRLEATWRSHPARLEARARDELGLRPASLRQTIFWEELDR